MCEAELPEADTVDIVAEETLDMMLENDEFEAGLAKAKKQSLEQYDHARLLSL